MTVQSIGSYAREQIAANPGSSNQELLDMVKKQFPQANTSIACIAWYKSNMKKNGYNKSAPLERTLEVIQKELEDAEFKVELLKEELDIKKEEMREHLEAQFEHLKKLLGKDKEVEEQQQGSQE